ncbi:MAG TPA: ABC transporter substrate-binding protein [Desulfotomaculum sp.]|nr:MAG: ABC transporter substrate-binding protein [Desulfotomaculum sp. BICA1-6]HBX24129.1 ABC transporter substrate-binding protein [Desulfotomaculum sp.]
MSKISGRLVILLSIVWVLVLAGCSSGAGIENSQTDPALEERIKVVASIYPVYDFTKKVGGDKIEVSCLVPPGAEPHDWEPSPRDMVELQKADVFIYCGAGMEQWVVKTLEALDKPGLAKIDAGQNIQLLTGHDHHQDGHEEPDIANADPHIWVDPLNAVGMVDNINAGLVEADPANKSAYEHNAGQYRQQILELHQEYQDSLAGAKGKEFVTSHDAFGYLAQQYGLIQVPLRGLSPEAEPTPARMVDVVKMVREKEIKYIFFESLVSPKVSEVIAAETGVETLVLNPVGGLTAEEIAAGKDYLSVMRENLVNLQKSFDITPY